MTRTRPDATAGAGAAAPAAGCAGLLAVDVVVEDEGWHALGDVEALVAAAARAVVALVDLGPDPLAAVVALDGDAAVRALNHRYRGKDAPTNVLSFPARQGAPGQAEAAAPHPLGDIVLARETVLAEAAEQAIAARDHLSHLVVHGLLHLAGYDHESDEDAAEMEALEVEILARLGIANPYAPAGGAPTG